MLNCEAKKAVKNNLNETNLYLKEKLKKSRIFKNYMSVLASNFLL